MSKSRNEKKPPAQPAPVPVSNDIIPGKFNENQWNFMVDEENGQDFVLDIVDEIVDGTIKVIYDKYIQRQLQPYSVEVAKDLLLQIIESRFLAHDKGEKFPENNTTWLEDEEPIPCVTDSWSQGSVPVQRCPSRPLSAKSDSGRKSIVPENEPTSQPSREEVQKSDDDDDDDEKRDEGKSERSCDGKLCQEHDVSLIQVVPSPPSTSKGSTLNDRRKTGEKNAEKRRKRLSNRKPVPQDDNPCENEKCLTAHSGPHQSTLSNPVQKMRNGRPPAEPEVTYDEKGNIIGMIRLSTDKLPTHRIKTRYNIIDPHNGNLLPSNQPPRTMTTKESLLNQLRDTEGFSVINAKKHHSKQTFISPSFKSNYSLEVMNKERDETVKPLPPPLMDSMNISAGVLIREGQVVREGPKMHIGPALHQSTKADILNLQPVGSLSRKPTISVSDIVGTTSPVVRQIRLPDPIPPIGPYHHG